MQTQQAYYEQHPERFRTRPTTPAPTGLVGINLPADRLIETQAERLQAA